MHVSHVTIENALIMAFGRAATSVAHLLSNTAACEMVMEGRGSPGRGTP